MTTAEARSIDAGNARKPLPAPALLAAAPGRRPRVALLIDPRFSGGTSRSVAAEISALAGHVDLAVCAVESRMFKGRRLHPAITAALDAHGLEPIWDPPVLRADTVLVHNPSFLRFNDRLTTRISCAEAIVVTHENLLRPGGHESFDVAACLTLLDGATVAGRCLLAPVSAYNRRTITDWLAGPGRGWPGRLRGDWGIAAEDWINIVDLPLSAPAEQPRDRRGRHSRPGLEKFPPLGSLREQFSERAERAIILGADLLLDKPETLPAHWDLRRFGSMAVDRFLAEIDFLVYFTHPLWRESFGRVVAEAIAAGKVVITHPETAATFAGGVHASEGDDVDMIVQGYLDSPGSYGAVVREGQAGLSRFSPETFRAAWLAALGAPGEAPSHDLV